MIVCPSCKEEIDDDSHYCDQCGQALLYCNICGRVGLGRRCTYCGGLMVPPDKLQHESLVHTAHSSSSSQGVNMSKPVSLHPSIGNQSAPGTSHGVPLLILYNDNLNIRIQGINGAVIGRRQGPYAAQLGQNRYVSGLHAQLKYNAATGWSVVDKHSSNGTRLNQRLLQPDVEMSLKNGDILTIANINLQVVIS